MQQMVLREGGEHYLGLTIHEPPAIGGDVGLEDVEVEVTEDLQHLQQNAILVHAVNLQPGGDPKELDKY